VNVFSSIGSRFLMNKGRSLILCEPSGGLCNRMRVLVSAIAFARDAGAVLRVVWKNDSHLGCRFDELFEMPSGVASIHHVSDGFFYRAANYAICKTFPNRFEQPDIEAIICSDEDFLDQVRGRRLFVRTHSSFYSASDFTLLQPIPPILNVVKKYGFDQRTTVGVHIRRTDNDIAIAHSPTELFLEAMRKELERNAETQFFVATDSPVDEKLMEESFPGKILLHRKPSLNRNESRAIKDALIDLYALASCRKVIGSYRSSFTDTAAAIFNVPLEIAYRSGEDVE